jgi:hypothetical protein
MSKDLVLLSSFELNLVDTNDIKDFLMAMSLHSLREKAEKEVYQTSLRSLNGAMDYILQLSLLTLKEEEVKEV